MEKKIVIRRNENTFVDLLDKKIYVTPKFLRNAGIMGSPEYKKLRELMTENPTFEVVERKVNQKANKVTYDELSFATMVKIINVSTEDESDRKRRLDEFESIKQFYANDDKGPNYGRVKSWFIKHYKDTYLEWYGKQHPKNKSDNGSTAKNETNKEKSVTTTNETNEDNSTTTNENE